MEIKPYAKNAKKHPSKQVEQIAASIREFGMNQPIVVDKDGVIIVGHGRYLALQLLGWELKPEWVVKKDDLTDEEVKAYRLADNKLNESAWDMQLVIEDLKDLSLPMIDLTGFSSDLILEDDDKDDSVPELPEEARTKEGDHYELGEHQLLCADSTKPESYTKLMGGAKADMVFTDPPYNVDYKGSGEHTGNTILNDKMHPEEFYSFLVDAFKAMSEHVKQTAGCYIFHSHKTASTFEKALEDSGFVIDTQLIWNKPSAGLGMNHYRTKHEPFFYCAKQLEKDFYGDRTGTTVWKVPDDEGRALRWYKKEMEAMEKGGSTIWTMKRANVNEYVHPTQKPVELPVVAMMKSSKREDIILDPFLGSGTTLIAAEKAGRVCCGMELDPRYVDTIVQRYVDYVDNPVVVLNGKDVTHLWQKTKTKSQTEDTLL